MYIQGLSSCSLQEIASLSSIGAGYGDKWDAEAAMLEFCQKTIGTKPGDCKPNGGYNYDYRSAPAGNKGSYTEGLGDTYVFHGVESPKSYSSSVGYAGKFAAYITEHDLGDVVAGKNVTNHRYHPDHACTAFIWNPNREKVFAWYELRRRGPKPAEPIPPIVIPEAAAAVAPPKKAAKPAKKAKDDLGDF